MCWKETFNFSSWMKANPCKWSYIYHAAHQSAATDVIHQSELLLHKLSMKDNGVNLVCWIPKCRKMPALLFHRGAYHSGTTIVPAGTNRSYARNTSRLPPALMLHWSSQSGKSSAGEADSCCVTPCSWKGNHPALCWLAWDQERFCSSGTNKSLRWWDKQVGALCTQHTHTS